MRNFNFEFSILKFQFSIFDFRFSIFDFANKKWVYCMSRTKRRPFSKAKSYCRACQCNGGCQYCLDNRRSATRKRLIEAADRLKEYLSV